MTPDTRITLQDIASNLGVSKMTVSLALREHPSIPEATRTRIQKTAAQMGYRRDPLLSALVRRRHSNKGDVRPVLGYLSEHTFKHYPAVLQSSMAYLFEGAKNHAERLGYRLDYFSTENHPRGIRGLADVLNNRGIVGLMLGPTKQRLVLPDIPWDQFVSVVLGNLPMQANLDYVCTHHQQLMTLAFEKLVTGGYKRPGLHVSGTTDPRVLEAWTAHYQYQLRNRIGGRSLQPLVQEPWEKAGFLAWVRKHKLDAIIGLNDAVIDWLRDEGYSVPDEVGFLHMDLLPHMKGIAGINQRKDVWGSTAVELLDFAIQRNYYGVRPSRRVTQIDGEWVDGASLCVEA